MKKKNTVLAIVATFLVIVSTQSAMALGYETVIDTKNDTFINDHRGSILAKQTTMAGVGHQLVGQRVRAAMPDLGAVKYTSRNNTYENRGKIKGIQTTVGGVGFQAVGQEVY